MHCRAPRHLVPDRCRSRGSGDRDHRNRPRLLRGHGPQAGRRPRISVLSSDRIDELQRMTPLNNDVWLPTIVAVNGVCAGGGLHFVADADVVLASADASFVDTHVSTGQVTALEPISLMSRIGLGSALEVGGARSGRAHRRRHCPAHRSRRRGHRTRRSSRAGRRAGARRRDRLSDRDRAVEAAIRASLALPLSEAMQAGWMRSSLIERTRTALEGPAPSPRSGRRCG